ncbi:MAG: sugar ABC transporter substrate-binding protein [Chloroflexi bacterium]|nr:sugar ABC transporter substrate-binding protein [Chloroflexota bacterium]
MAHTPHLHGTHLSRRRLLISTLGLAAVPILAACGGQSAAPAKPAESKPAAPAKPAESKPAAPAAQPAATTAPAGQSAPAAKSGGPVTLSMIGLAGHPSWIATKEMLKAYKEKAPNVEIKTSEFDLPQINDKVNIDFQAKKGEYDIVWMNSAQTVGYWTEAGIVVPLDDMVSKSYDLDDFLKLARGIGTMKGKLYGIAIMIEERMLSYRKDLFEAASLKVPTTVDEMTAAAEKLTNKEKNQFGFSQRNRAGGSSGYDWMGWLYGYGGLVFDKDYKTHLNDPEAKAALDAFLKIEKFGSPASNKSYGEIVKELQTGVAAMANDVTIITPLLEDPKQSQFAGKFGYAVAPAGPKGPRPETSAHLLAISSLSKQKEPAWQFVEWMTSKENAKPWIFAGGAAFRESMYKDQEILAKYPQYTMFKEILDKGNPDYVPRVKPSSEILTKVSDEINAAVVGVKDSTQALKDADQNVNAILKRDGYQK